MEMTKGLCDKSTPNALFMLHSSHFPTCSGNSSADLFSCNCCPALMSCWKRGFIGIYVLPERLALRNNRRVQFACVWGRECALVFSFIPNFICQDFSGLVMCLSGCNLFIITKVGFPRVFRLKTWQDSSNTLSCQIY